MKFIKENHVIEALIAVALAVLLFFGAPKFFPKSSGVQAAEIVEPHNIPGVAEINVQDDDGTRHCDIYTAKGDAGMLEKATAYAKKKGCQIKTYFTAEEPEAPVDQASSSTETTVAPADAVATTQTN